MHFLFPTIEYCTSREMEQLPLLFDNINIESPEVAVYLE